MADLQISPILPCIAPFPTVAEVGADWYSFPSQEVVEITHDRPRTGCSVQGAKLCLLFFSLALRGCNFLTRHLTHPSTLTSFRDHDRRSGPRWVELVLGNGYELRRAD